MNQTENNPCAACHQKCCCHYTVTVTGYDAWLIATRLQLAMEQFLIYFPASKADSDNFKLDHSGRVFNIALAKKEEEADEKPCVFWLSLPDGYGRCGIYPLRPLVCQNYPAFLSDGIVQLRTDVMCPPRSWNLAAMNLQLWRERLLRFQMEYDIYCYIVEKWNDFVEVSPQEFRYPVNIYCAYLMAVYNQLEQLRQAISAKELVAILQQWEKCTESRISPLKHNGERSYQGVNPIWTEFVSNLRRMIENFFVHKNFNQQLSRKSYALIVPGTDRCSDERSEAPLPSDEVRMRAA